MNEVGKPPVEQQPKAEQLLGPELQGDVVRDWSMQLVNTEILRTCGILSAEAILQLADTDPLKKENVQRKLILEVIVYRLTIDWLKQNIATAEDKAAWVSVISTGQVAPEMQAKVTELQQSLNAQLEAKLHHDHH
jgi:hypothetical protein